MKNKIFIFFRAWLTVLLTVFNTWLIAHNYNIAVICLSFFYSLSWSLNVKSISIGGWGERFSYCFGGCVGTATALYIASLLPKGGL